MSGGAFDYKQWHIEQIAEDIDQELKRQGKPKDPEELYMDDDYYIEYPEAKKYPIYPEEVQKIMKEGVDLLRKAHVYAQRIDWYLSGDDGDESLIKRLKFELEKLEELKKLESSLKKEE